jgi:hypothetical protein
MKRQEKKSFCGAKKTKSLDTLAQLATNIHKDTENQAFEDLKSLGENKEVLKKRARRNYLKNALALGLVDVNNDDRKKRIESAENVLQELEADKTEKDILRSYWSMYHCSNKLTRKNGKVSGRYCKNRLCLVCNSIRTAALLTSYKPVFDEWGEDAYFVTLTAPTVKESKLNDRVNEMHSIFFNIKETLKMRYLRNTSEKFEGVRKLECTYNPFTDKYHPHFHFMIKGKDNAETVYNEWLKRTKYLGTSKKAQDCQKARKGAAMEVFKYFTKIVSSSSKDRNIYLKSLDVIFKEFRGRRVIQSFGFKLPKVEKTTVVEEIKSEEVQSIEGLQRFLSEKESDKYISISDLLEKFNRKPCFREILEWAEDERKRGLPFLEISTILEILEALRKELEDYEENFKWSQELGDWISEDTGEFLTDFEVSEDMKKLTGRMVKILRKDWKKKEK